MATAEKIVEAQFQSPQRPVEGETDNYSETYSLSPAEMARWLAPRLPAFLLFLNDMRIAQQDAYHFYDLMNLFDTPDGKRYYAPEDTFRVYLHDEWKKWNDPIHKIRREENGKSHIISAETAVAFIYHLAQINPDGQIDRCHLKGFTPEPSPLILATLARDPADEALIETLQAENTELHLLYDQTKGRAVTLRGENTVLRQNLEKAHKRIQESEPSPNSLLLSHQLREATDTITLLQQASSDGAWWMGLTLPKDTRTILSRLDNGEEWEDIAEDMGLGTGQVVKKVIQALEELRKRQARKKQK